MGTRSEQPNCILKRFSDREWNTIQVQLAGLDLRKIQQVIDQAQKRIGLSLREAHDDLERHRLQDYQRQAAVATSTVGDAIKQNYPRNDYRNKNYDEG